MNEDLKVTKQSKFSMFLIALLGAMIGGLIVGGIFLAVGFFSPGEMMVESGSQQVIVTRTEADTMVEAIAQVVPQSVVGIETIVTGMTLLGPQQGSSVGSGFVLTSDGYIATNHHVVDGGSAIQVSLEDGSSYEGELIWSDPILDMAVIKVDAKNLPVLELGDSDAVEVGELAVAVGNPLGLNFERTVTAGIISALNRSIPLENGLAEDLIQTDASINQGNSGGPLINKKGKVIGINTYKLNSGEGMGFAIPINILKPILNEVVTTGRFDTTVIGITAYDRAIADYYLTDAEVDFSSGIYIASVQPGYGAAEAGLKAGDIILEIDGVLTNTMLKMKEILYAKDGGEKVLVKYERDGVIATSDVRVSIGQ